MNRAEQQPGPQCTTESVIQAALDAGAEVVGIAPLERFAGDAGGYLHTGYRPDELLPGARSVIVVVARVLDGVLSSNLEQIDTTYAFGNFGYVHLNRRLNAITYTLANWLETAGWPSLPLGPCGSTRFDLAAYEREATVGPVHGIFSLKRAAVLAGVGRRARSGMVATLEHGIRVRLGAVITTAPLVGSPVLEGTPCPPDCGLCIKACPMNAIGSDGVVNHVRCYSDKGRRGRTEAETLDEMAKAIPAHGAAEGYLAHEHTAIDGSGNRMCRCVCMAVCPLWQVSLPAP